MIIKAARQYGWIILITLLLAIVYITMARNRTGGTFAAPLDDAYIHFQYARQMSIGEPWQYNSGDKPTSGATSTFYPLILAAGLLVGVPEESIVWFAAALGVAALMVSAVVISLITEELMKRMGSISPFGMRLGIILAAALFLLSGPISWAYFNGMETGVFTLLMLASFYCYLTGRITVSSAALFLAAVTRPEALFMTAVFWLVIFLDWQRYENRNSRRSMLVAPTLALMLSLTPLILNYSLTGSTLATGAQAKSWFLNAPFRFGDIVQSIGRGLLMILQRLSFGVLADPGWPLLPLLLPLALIGWIGLWIRKQYSAVGLSAGWLFVGLLSTATLITAVWQHGRYQVPFVALLIPIAVVGTALLLEKMPVRLYKIAWAGLAVILGAALIWQLSKSVDSFAQSVNTTTKQQIAVAEWIDNNLPEDSVVAVHDAGIIRYVGRRPTIDMIGLTTEGMANAWRQGMGAVYEQMEEASKEASKDGSKEGAPLPTHFATYPNVFSIPYLQNTALFHEELIRFEVPDYSEFSAAGPTQAVYEADWRLAGSGSIVRQADILLKTDNMTLTDSVDIANLADEKDHNLTWWEGAVVPGFPTELRQMAYRAGPEIEVLDGGRLLTGGLRFQAAAAAQEDLHLIGRFHAQDEVAINVTANGANAGVWRYPAIPGEWLESSFTIPARFIDGDMVEIEMTLSPEISAGVKFEPYYFWTFQGDSGVQDQPDFSKTNILFDGGIELVGYTLELDRFQPGEELPVTLFWRTDDGSDKDAVVFLHLYDENGEIIAQTDQGPYYGTRPPYTWDADQLLLDPKTLLLPDELPEGEFQLAVGLYDPQTFLRLQILGNSAGELTENRLQLETIVRE